jgi:hypothetical protein
MQIMAAVLNFKIFYTLGDDTGLAKIEVVIEF